MELGGFGIRTNSIAPGVFKSEITSALMEKEWLQRVCDRTSPLKTYGTTNPAITSIIRYLIHDLSEYVSGNNFMVDAGGSLPGVPIFSSL
jgi:NAD(P)-dependent dehydrogenase (short-subunit alcohol dehydrogenase family)